jgi:hypothetical protein
MQIWHDDLGLQDDRHELRVLFQSANPKVDPFHSQVTRADVAVAASHIPHVGWVFYEFYLNVRLLLLAGF